MSTSNVTSFNQSRDQIITDSLCLLGVYGQGDIVSPNDITFCSNILEKMVKGWEGQGIHLWTANEGSIFLTLNQQVYKMASGDTDISGDDAIFNTLTTAASGSNLTVGSTTGITAGDNIGIKLDNNTLQWTTVSSVTSSTILALNASVSSTASAGNNVFSFTNRIDRPLHITSARFRSASGYERPIEVKGRTDFMNLPNKASTGKANQWFYAPKVSESYFRAWPVADDVGDCINISYIRRIQDFNASNYNADLPQEWLECITYNLCIRIAPSYGINTQKLNPDISMIANQSLGEMAAWDCEEGDLRINGNYRFD